MIRYRKGRAPARLTELERAGYSMRELHRIDNEHQIQPGTTTPEHAEFVRYHVRRWQARRP